MRGAAFFLGLILLAGPGRAAEHVHRNPIPPRLQWNANGGYCGEVSLISAGLYFGQYMSQYEARICAIGHTPQKHGEMLLGYNDRHAAKVMRLKSVEWDGRRPRTLPEFLGWVKRHVLLGHPVIIGVYNNEYLLYGHTNPDAGDPQYDHIVPVSQVISERPFGEQKYFATDRLTFSDNGLWSPAGRPAYFFTYPFGRFPGSRAQANAPDGPVYTLPDYGRNYGIAITGIRDSGGDALPIRVITNKNYEHPSMARDSNRRPRPMRLTLTVTVSGLEPDVAYRLYRYDRTAKIPAGRFNAHARKAAQTWDIRIARGSTFKFRQRIWSNEVAAYRCVRADAP